MARQFINTINRHIGKAELVHLPERGISGNLQFLLDAKAMRNLPT